jgi:hypothetical protein
LLIGIIIGLAALAVDLIAFMNRDVLDERPRVLQYLPYLVGAIAAIGLAVAVAVTLGSPGQLCGRDCLR